MDVCVATKRIIGLSLLTISYLITPPTYAAEPPRAANVELPIPGAIEPARVGEQLSQQLMAGAPVTQGAQPVVGPVSQGSLPAKAAALKFKLTDIRITGATIFTPAQLLAPYHNLFGQQVSLGEIDAMARQMAVRYHNAGYVLTRVILPPQRIHNGIVTFQVIEGYVENVDVVGKLSPGVRELIMRYAQKVARTKPLQVKDLERYVLLANDVPGMAVRAVVNPSKTTPGAADVLFVTEEKKWNTFTTVNNYGTKFLGPVQLLGGATFNSVFRPGDSTSLQLVTTGNNEVNFGYFSHSELLGSEGLQLTVSGYYNNNEPGLFLEQFDIVGRSTSITADLAYPLIRSRQNTLYVHGNFNMLNSKSTSPNPFVLSYDDHIRPIDLGLMFYNADSWHGYNQISFDATQGLPILDHSGSTNISRPNGHSVFTSLHLNGSRIQALPWNFSIFLNAQSQYGFQPLLAAAQFGFGGSVLGRGYDPSEITGDSGLAGTFELRFDQMVNSILLKSNQYYAFYDAGVVWNRDQQSFIGQQSATSTGLGMRMMFTNFLLGNLYVAKPLTHDVAAVGNRNARVFFALTVLS